MPFHKLGTFVLLVMVISSGYSQDTRLFNTVSGSYKVSQYSDHGGKEKTTTIDIIINPPNNKLQFSSIDEIWAYLTLPLPSFSKPKNICFVIDISRSMRNPINNRPTTRRIEWVKEICDLLFKEIRAEDFISVVVFNDTPKILIPPQHILTSDDRTACIDKIKSLEPWGSTVIAEGLNLGYSLVKEHYNKAYINRVLLLTDGEAEKDKEPIKQIVKTNHDQGIGTASTIALSADADNKLMNELAVLGGGLSIRIINDDRNFEDKLKTLMYSNWQEIKREIDALFNKAIWDMNITISLAAGVSLSDSPPRNGITPEIAGNRITYSGLSLKRFGSITIRFDVSLNDEALTNYKERILSFSISNEDRDKRFPVYQKDHLLSLNHRSKTEKAGWIVFQDNF